MLFPLIVCSVTGLLVFLSVLFLPTVKLGKFTVGTYWLVSFVGAVVLLLGGAIPFSVLGEKLLFGTGMNPVKILVLFFSMTSLSVFLDEIGFFRYLANLALRKTGKRQLGLFVILYLVVSVLTVFTSNDIVILTFTPFICFFAKEANINPLPYLFTEFVAANTWSMLLIIGNPTNIYLASSAGVDFVGYMAAMALPSLFAGVVSFFLLFLLFRRDMKAPITVETRRVYIEDKPSLVLGILHLGVCTLLLAVSSYLSFEMQWIAAGFAISLFVLVTAVSLWRRQPLDALRRTVRRLPYELIPFVLSMFTLVAALEYAGVTELLSGLLFSGEPIYTVGASSFLLSNVINNIPMSVLYSSVIGEMSASSDYLSAVYAAVIGSNIGAFFTQVGALAGIMWASILRRFGVDFSFKKFVLYGVLLSIPTLFASLFGLSLAM